jgi:hypothetical protein
MGTPERNATPISTSTRLKSKASASACTASTLRRPRLDMLLAAERVHHGRLETLAQRQNLVVSAPASRAAQDRHGTEQGEGRATDRARPRAGAPRGTNIALVAVPLWSDMPNLLFLAAGKSLLMIARGCGRSHTTVRQAGCMGNPGHFERRVFNAPPQAMTWSSTVLTAAS